MLKSNRDIYWILASISSFKLRFVLSEWWHSQTREARVRQKKKKKKKKKDGDVLLLCSAVRQHGLTGSTYYEIQHDSFLIDWSRLDRFQLTWRPSTIPFPLRSGDGSTLLDGSSKIEICTKNGLLTVNAVLEDAFLVDLLYYGASQKSPYVEDVKTFEAKCPPETFGIGLYFPDRV